MSTGINTPFNLIFRAMSLESILDSESVAADGGRVSLRIKPGVYQKRPDVVLAEMDHKRYYFSSNVLCVYNTPYLGINKIDETSVD